VKGTGKQLMTQSPNTSVRAVRALGRLLVLTAAASLIPCVAAARDSDADGVADHVDAYPCDPTTVAAAFAPAENTHGMLMFEDMWPSSGDADFNDLVVTYNYAFLLSADDGSDPSTAPVKSMQISYNVLARGAGLRNGIGLRLPVAADAAAGATITRNFDDGVLTPLTPIAGESQLVLDVVHDAAEAAPFANTDPSQRASSATSFTVLIDFARPVRIDLSQAPFDVFMFRSDDFSHQIHQARYRGTDAMNTALFGTAEDGSTNCASGSASTPHCFVDKRGLPFALNVPSSVSWMSERQTIDIAYPDIVGFAATGGAQHAGTWRRHSSSPAETAPRRRRRACSAPGSGTPTRRASPSAATSSSAAPATTGPTIPLPPTTEACSWLATRTA
jgi:LruC domain-containing protein